MATASSERLPDIGPSPEPLRRLGERLYAPAPLAGAAVVVGWTALYLAYRGHWAGVALALVTTGIALVALRRGAALRLLQQQSLRAALDEAHRSAAAAAARNRELDRLRHLAGTLLAGRDLQTIFLEVASAAADLLQAEGGAVTIVVEEGRFLKVLAATGPLAAWTGLLLPADRSLHGAVIGSGQPILAEDLRRDPRTYRPEGSDLELRTAAMVPLRSAGVVIGAVSVYNRADGRPFDPYDLQLLQTLGDQAVVGLDRMNMLEESLRNERALAQKNRELQRATQLKDEFLANMSHELRTPLNAIIGFSDLLLTEGLGPVSETQRDFLESVLRNGKHLLGLINSILDLSKIEAGRMTLDLAPTDFHEVVARAVADTTSLRVSKGQGCRVDLGPDPVTIVADAVRVQQILYNLLANASKFTPDGGRIAVSLVRTRTPLPVPAERAGEHPRLVVREAVWVAVSDDGIGIRPEDTAKLFVEFSQVDASPSRRQQGTGLGLALSKRFVEMHGGQIGAESVYGRGSTFWFILPVEGPVRRRPPAVAPER